MYMYSLPQNLLPNLPIRARVHVGRIVFSAYKRRRTSPNRLQLRLIWTLRVDTGCVSPQHGEPVGGSFGITTFIMGSFSHGVHEVSRDILVVHDRFADFASKILGSWTQLTLTAIGISEFIEASALLKLRYMYSVRVSSHHPS